MERGLRLILHKPRERPNGVGLLNQAVLVVRSCFLFNFALQYLFLCAGDFSWPVCLVLSLSAHRSGLFLFRQVNALDCALYLAVQSRPHWPGSQI